MSDNEIYNGALFLLGERAILDFTGNTSKPAVLIQRIYPGIRDALLNKHPWRFAAKRAALAPAGASPEWGFTYLFPTPSDYIRLIQVKDNASHKTADQGILANENPLYIEYVYRCKNASLYSVEFADCLKLDLAVELCIPLTNDRDLYDRLVTRAEKKFRQSTFISSTQTTDDEDKEQASDPWLDVR